MKFEKQKSYIKYIFLVQKFELILNFDQLIVTPFYKSTKVYRF